MKVLLTFDVEVWCGGWDHLDRDFPAAFARYVYGERREDGYALPKTLEILNRHELKGVFFVEPLFAARFGESYLSELISLIRDAGQDVQLHLHPEWIDEMRVPPVALTGSKRPYLWQFSAEDQQRIVSFAVDLLQSCGADRPSAFRAGSFGAGANTFRALAEDGIRFDSSVNATYADSVPDARESLDLYRPSVVDGVASVPVGVFRDGFGRQRHAQVGACSFRELSRAIESAHANGWKQYVLFSHNFEMLRPGSAAPDRTVVARFERLCRYLRENARSLPTATFDELDGPDPGLPDAPIPAVAMVDTTIRYAEQLLRRMM